MGLPLAHGEGAGKSHSPRNLGAGWAELGCVHGAWAKWKGFVAGIRQPVKYMAAVPSLVTRGVVAHPLPHTPQSLNPESSQPRPADGECNE